ncbi:hypothetical protein BT63DRAFT_409875 [Microthyrium microscopicum]|uniref:NADH-ubiquinone oxidoreductase 29.9 kDa subunit n=1 Tax=Microthyrium microscopicum TaxID=703497 RepID=A0A6A6UMR0_9PEZI|nr:hypothetical protein BT63DRAFT_409875 [Microthyrium microscopicum]
MRPATRLLAAVRSARTLEPGTPTGLTGLATHPSPRSTLIFLYSSILSKLEQVPEHSIYRQATAALTNKRLAIVEAVRPAGFDRWESRMAHELAELTGNMSEEQRAKLFQYKGRTFVPAKMWEPPVDLRKLEWDGEILWSRSFGPQSQEDADRDLKAFQVKNELEQQRHTTVEQEPLLTVSQQVDRGYCVTETDTDLCYRIEELEEKIGAGLIEEVIQVAEGENKLVDTMIENKVWEDLTEKAPEGQWSYFERQPQS